MDSAHSESESLIKLGGFHRSYSGNDEDGKSCQTSDVNLSMFRDNEREVCQNGYIEKSVQHSENITFTWNEINVFALEKNNIKDGLLRRWHKNNHPLPRGKRILKNVNGVARPGEVLAILGSSGAGKTTLLNCLTSRSSSRLIVSGLRCANGIPISSNYLTSQLAYVQQDDLFIGSLTVMEHLIFQALVRMDSRIPYKQRMKRVEEVIAELGLGDCEHTLIGIRGRLKGISGGEMKRLSFAAEVLTNPSLMFCDEPTSGLDSFMALNVVQVLKRLAQTGKTVVCTIHQPSSELYAMFDKILLMTEGRVAFLGTPGEVNAFFTKLETPCPHNYNPADYFIQLLAISPGREEFCKSAVSMICDKFERSEYGVKLAVEAATVAQHEYKYSDFIFNGRNNNSRYKASWFAQFRAVLWRSWISLIKEPLLFKVRMLQTIITAFIVGAVFFGQKLDQEGVMNINGALFILLMNMTFQNSFAVINVFCTELPLFLREHRNGMYRTDVYFISKVLAETPIFILIPLTATMICYYMIGLNQEQPKFFIAGVILMLVTNVAVSFGYLASCLSNNIGMALSIAPLLMMPFFLFGGFFLNVDSIPFYLKWLSYISWFRYGNEALMINQWGGIENINCSTAVLTCPRDGHAILEVYNFSEDNLVPDLIALGGLIFGFRFLAYLSLLLKTYTMD